MRVSLKTVLMAAAVVCFGLAAIGASGRLVPAGLCCWALAVTLS